MKSFVVFLVNFYVIFELVYYCAAQITTTGLLKGEEFECPTGIKLKENDCNGCFCTSQGELACTLHECPENKGKQHENCTLHTSWQKDCNKCWCITIGTVCTDLEC